MAPLYYRKGAREGKRYYVDEVFYDYADGKTVCRQHRQKSDGSHTWLKKRYGDCVYDMLNMFIRARSFNPEGDPARIVYRGKQVVKGDNGVKYRCLQLSYMEKDGDKWKKVVDFYVTDDDNHIPVRLDMFLRFGSAKAFVVGIKGNRNAIASVVK